jgi:hypothetical protein
MPAMHAQESHREVSSITIDGDITIIAVDQGENYSVMMSSDSWSKAVARLRAGRCLKGLALVMTEDGDVAIAFMVGDQAGFVIRRPVPVN